jgi:deoxyribonuclease IV
VRIGAHIRRGGSDVDVAIAAAREVGADTVQVFLSSPRTWAGPRVTPERVEAFATGWAPSGLGPLVVHAPYLVNIASPNPIFLEKSRSLIDETLRACDAYGVSTLVVHSGAGGPGEPSEALARAAETLREATESPVATRIAVELMAGTSGAVASTVAEAARLFSEIGAAGAVDLCLDTCHAFAAGYALDRPEGVADLFDELGRHGLLERLTVVHANDSKFGRGERRDRHENIGDGHIGAEGFRAMLERPELAELTLVLETPGEPERRARDIALLRSFVPV